MENNSASVVPSEPTQKSRERRSRPAKSAQKFERVGDNTKQVATTRVSEDRPEPPSNIMHPVSVIKRNPKLNNGGATKLNPAASEFKPSSEVSTDSAPTGDLQKKVNNRNRNTRQKKDAPVEQVGVAHNNNDHVERVSDVRSKAPRSRPRKPKTLVAVPSTETEPVPEELIELSCPICTDSAAYFAVGKCNHHVCSLCAVRMRVKSKDTHCAICKEDLNVMVIYNAHSALATKTSATEVVDESQLLRPFNSFGLTAADCDLDNGNIPGLQVDPSAGFLFVDCAKHYNELETLRAIVCPFKHCKARFPTIQTLQRHLKEQHKDSALCTLCVENRPLFISEHTVMNPKQLMCHFKGEEFVEAHGHGQHRASNSENVHTKGHPQCEFCTERFFDNAALYYHMQRQYFTCHLCPRQHMFRYYIDAAALREHHNRDHIVCSICAASPQLYDSDVAIAFRDAREYSDHMRHVHNAHVSSAAGGSNHNKTSFRLGASSTYQSNNPSSVRRDKNGRPRVTVVDLEMGSANPNARPDVEITGNNAARAAAAAAGRPADSSVAAMIPSNMRIAGRVIGGRFAEIDSQDLLMQAAAEEHAAEAERQARGQKKTLRVSREQAFPALSASAAVPAVLKNRVWSAKVGGSQGEFSGSDAPTGTSSANDSPLPGRPAPAAELHPMSLLHSSKQQAKDLQKRKDAEAAEKAHQEKLRLEDKRIERNLSLASALLGGNASKGATGLNLTAADVGATLKNRSYVSSIVAPLSDLGWTEAELMRPIYPPVLVNWARLHQSELLKIEKKIYGLMTDASLNSVQLKPMARGMRIVVHQLSRMYLLNSYEYDPEPNRYVSLVKQVDSYLPSYVLSRSAALPVHTLPGENGTEIPDLPVIYLTLSSESYSAGLVNTNSSVSSTGKKAPAPGVTSSSAESVRIAFTTAEIVSRIKDLLESPDLWRAWYQYALEVGAPAGPAPAVPEMVLNEFGEYEEVPVPPPPPGFAASPAVKPRALSELPVPRIASLVAAGASSVGLRFADRTSAQFAAHFMNFCVSLHYSSSGSNTKMSSRAQYGAIALDTAQLSPKQQQQLTVLSVFSLNAAFSICSVADLVYAIPSSDKGGVAAAPRAPGSDVQAATLDRRHYMPASAAEDAWTPVSKVPKPVAATSVPYAAKPVGEDGWQFQAVKTRRYDANDPAVNKAVPVTVQDSWEDFDQDATEFNQKLPASEEQAERAEEWESFLTEKRSKAEQSGVARYQPKRSEPTAPAAVAAPAAGKYIPPSARVRAPDVIGGEENLNRKPSAVTEEDDEEVFAEEAYALDGEVTEPLEEEYDLCESDSEEGVAHASASEPAQTFATDYMDSEEAFEEYLRQLQLQHEQGETQAQNRGSSQQQGQRGGGGGRQGQSQPQEVVALPFNAALSRAAPSVFDNSPSSAMAVVAIPISDDVTDEEAAREVLRKQMKKEQGASQYNKFGVLDEEDADNDA